MSTLSTLTFVALLVPAVALGASPECAKPPSAAHGEGKPEVRRAAQRGLDYLAKETVAWQRNHNCYGCHVQAVTLEALSVGKHHRYDVSARVTAKILQGMLTGRGGHSGPNGLSVGGSGLPADSKAFGGAAFARYDQYAGGEAKEALLQVARQLLKYQKEDGQYAMDPHGHGPPIKVAGLQGTFQAMQTWRQAFASSADEAWLPPLRKAERYIQRVAASWTATPSIQELDYALMGLVAAGAGSGEPLVDGLTKKLVGLQNEDGGFGFAPGKPSNAFTTGQALYTLRLAGFTDADASVGRALAWLVEKQNPAGHWSNAGSAKAEAMWAVLGLVSVDVVTIDVAGIEDGGHTRALGRISVQAKDNRGQAVHQVAIAIDDEIVAHDCGSKLAFDWPRVELSPGKHIVEFIATNAKGETSRRAFEVHAGDVFLTELGSRFVDGGTAFSMRNIGRRAGDVRLTIKTPAGKTVHTSNQTAEPGPMSFHWADGKRGKYIATIAYVDAKATTRQTERIEFFQATEAEQRDSFAQVQGSLQFGTDKRATANALVELVDDKGNVIARTRTTARGQYRFKNVDSGKYKVRLKKRGFKAIEQKVDARAGEEADAALTVW